jgi:hypothetical protein
MAAEIVEEFIDLIYLAVIFPKKTKPAFLCTGRMKYIVIAKK